MQKIRNRKEDVISESFEGLTLAYEKYWIRHPEVKGIISRTRRKDKVSLVIGGGSGHEPLYSCFVGPGLADAAVCGNIFASPDPNTIVKTAEDVRGMILAAADKIIRNMDYLTEIDNMTGDGDHGLGMAQGMRNAAAALLSMDTGDNAFAPFAAAGRAMLLSMGGASGVIFGSMFLAGDSFAPKSVLTGSDLGLLEAKALETVKERGGAARFGKAKSLGERALGYQDAGATSVSLIFEAMREFVEG